VKNQSGMCGVPEGEDILRKIEEAKAALARVIAG
jgi:hypothetical protein